MTIFDQEILLRYNTEMSSETSSLLVDQATLTEARTGWTGTEVETGAASTAGSPSPGQHTPDTDTLVTRTPGLHDIVTTEDIEQDNHILGLTKINHYSPRVTLSWSQ